MCSCYFCEQILVTRETLIACIMIGLLSGIILDIIIEMIKGMIRK